MGYESIPMHGYDGFWYRCDIRSYGSFNEDGDHLSTYDQVIWRKFGVVKYTPKGVWLVEASLGDPEPEKSLNMDTSRRFVGPWFVRGQGKKQLALPTKELAWEDCRQRKLRHVQGCRQRLIRAENQLDILNFDKPRILPFPLKEEAHA